VEARISISLPARGRTILGTKALTVFTASLPFVIEQALLASSCDAAAMTAFVESAEDQDFLRSAVVADSLYLIS
jgi:predicted ABC-class ATPase